MVQGQKGKAPATGTERTTKMTTYTTINDYCTTVVEPALAGSEGHWDSDAVDEIAEKVLIQVDGGYIQNPDIEENDWWDIAVECMLPEDRVQATYSVFTTYDKRQFLYIQVDEGEHQGTEWEVQIQGKPTREDAERLFAQVRADGWEFHSEPGQHETTTYLIPPASA